MEFATVQNLIESLSPWIIIVLVPFIFWQIPVWKTRIESKVENVELRQDKLDERYDKSDEKYLKLQEKIDDLYKLLLGAIGPQFLKSGSPLRLTDHGNKISERIAAARIANNCAVKIIDKTVNLNAYEIQEFCFEFCKGKLLEELEKDNFEQYEIIQTVAFEEGVEIEKITRVIAIELRDKILSMKGTAHSEIDEHSPD